MSTAPQPHHENAFLHFFSVIGHDIEDIAKWAPSFGGKVKQIVERIEELKQLNPEFLKDLATIAESVAALAANAGVAVAQKGLNPVNDISTLKSIDDLIKNFEHFYPIVEEGIKILEGKKVNGPVTVVDPGSPSIGDVIVTAVQAPAEVEQEVQSVETAVDPAVKAIEQEIASDASSVHTEVKKS